MSTDPKAGVGYPNDLEWPRLRRRVTPPDHYDVLELAVRLAYRVPGNIVEFGVFEGGSTRALRRALRRLQRGQILGPRKQIFACDSFEGLPEPYENREAGSFACTPPQIRGVHIIEGSFEESLTVELARRVGRVALASLDADVYSSTLCALRWLTPLLDAGSLVLFDEYLGADGAAECRAHEDWARETGVQTVRIAEFLRETSGQDGDRDHGSSPDRRVLFQVIGATEPMSTRVVRVRDVPRITRRVVRRLTRVVRR